MVLDFATCHKAIRSRDARFDGRFFTGVMSTGIYCRPVCPAQTPLERNVRFYPSAAAAQAAGFRACRRCRPETAPGSPDWDARADLVGRALRLIADGAAEAEGVDGLARRLAVSPRHLHRELAAAVGAGPLALARTRRAQTARLLIDQTAMPLTEVTFAAGYASIRQFNDSIAEAFGASPTELRRREQQALDADGGVILRLEYRPPLAAAPLLGFLARRALPGVEEVRDGRYRRTVAFGRSTGTIELEPVAAASHVLLRLRLDDLRDLGPAVQRCRRLLDLDVDPAAVEEVLRADTALAPLLAARPDLRVPGAVDGWEMAARAILGQQVSVTGARTLAGRLVAALGAPLARADGDLTHRFPRPAAIADADLAGLGLPRSRAAALGALARTVADGKIALDRGADREEAVRRLRALPGVGPWTASYVAMRALGDPDAFPAGDLGLRRALERRGIGADGRALSARSEAWRPWRAYAAMHLWESLNDTHEEEETG